MLLICEKLCELSVDKEKIGTIKFVLICGIGVLIVKFVAFYITNSNGILTDALESVINVFAGFVALIGLKYAAKPKDEDHPYGHGKIEFVTSGFEGGLIIFAGIAMIGKGIYNIIHPQMISSLDIGILLTLIGGLINGSLGFFLKKKAKKLNSPALEGDSAHLLSDAYSSIGLIIGLTATLIFEKVWIDNLMAIGFGLFILITGSELVKKSLSGLLDKADFDEIEVFIDILNRNRIPEWIDVHNLRMQKFGSNLHLDLHVTFPWYFELNKVHEEMEKIENLLNEVGDRKIEVFIHPDPCIEKSCSICSIADCTVRKAQFQKRIDWNSEYLLPNQKHGL